jgi:hypothetical protein
MPLHDDLGALRAPPVGFRIDLDQRVRFDVKERLAGGLILVIDMAEFKFIEPDAAASPATDVDREVANLQFAQSPATSRTFHGCPPC